MSALAKETYRTVFISDVHLGSRGCRADALGDFLKSMTCEHLFLVGDIVDGWRIARGGYWDEASDRVVRRVLKMARHGTAVTYIPGNHDEVLRRWIPPMNEVAGIRFERQSVHVTADGRRLLILHGDEFDGVIRYANFLAHVGDWGYDLALWANRWLNVVRRKMGYPYWSLSRWLKSNVKEAVKTMDRFEQQVAIEARSLGMDGVVCGHIHKAERREVDGILYLNCGDWVESCTALVERHDGTLEIVEWSGKVHALATEAADQEDETPKVDFSGICA
jgi:UDP-2,3-diacylglucosamine pyrophosphatase LpxH